MIPKENFNDGMLYLQWWLLQRQCQWSFWFTCQWIKELEFEINNDPRFQIIASVGESGIREYQTFEKDESVLEKRQ